MDRRLNNFACRIDMDIMNFAYAGFLTILLALDHLKSINYFFL
jgi:hypothetical protein